MRRRRQLSLAAGWLIVLHLVALLAGFFAPYDPTAQHRSFPLAPPTSIHLVDETGNWRRPFVYGVTPQVGTFGQYREDRTLKFPVRLAPAGKPDQFDANASRHLFGVDEPGRIFLMGTDEYGRDLFSRLVHGVRISLAAGLLATLLALSLGVLVGSAAGWLGGWTDGVIMRAGELFVSLPWLYLLFGVRAFLPLNVPPEQAFLLFVGIAGIIGWAKPARLVRGMVMTAREREYVSAARGFGASQVYLLKQHIAPQVWPLILTQASLLIPRYILAESTLSFLGLGIGEPVPSWGGLLGRLQQYHVLASYWWAFLPVPVMMTVFAAFYIVSEELKEPGFNEVGASLTPWYRRAARVSCLSLLLLCLALCRSTATGAVSLPDEGKDFLIDSGETGRTGGRLVVALRSEPKTLNPVVALDATSRSVIERLSADLIHIARDTQRTQPALARSWSISPDGKQYTLSLRRGLRFSDGRMFDADDVVFTFQVHLDERLLSPQRDLLVVGGKPITLQKIDSHTVRFTLSQPYAAAERLFDSIAILPRHLLETTYQQGKLTQAWNLTTPPGEIAGLGPFRLKEYVPGQRIVLSRNPHFWVFDKAGNRLPYLDELVLVFAGSEDSQVIRFQSGEADVVSRLSAENFAVLEKDQHNRGYRLHDVGPGLEYHFLLFNLNHALPDNLAEVRRKQQWFRDVSFRRAVSMAVDRDAIVRLVYRGRAAPIASHVTPGNRFWLNRKLNITQRSIDQARGLLKNNGYSWTGDGILLDPEGLPVEFSIVTNAGNSQRQQIATIIQHDLKQLGMRVQSVTLESRAVNDRIFNTFDYEAAVTAIAGGDADPNAEMNVWLSRGSTHLWNLTARQGGKLASWEAEIDRLMQEQLITLNAERRKELYDRVQEHVAQQLPIIPLVSPNILVGVKASLGNVRPAVLNDYVLWNAEQIFRRPGL